MFSEERPAEEIELEDEERGYYDDGEGVPLEEILGSNNVADHACDALKYLVVSGMREADTRPDEDDYYDDNSITLDFRDTVNTVTGY